MAHKFEKQSCAEFSGPFGLILPLFFIAAAVGCAAMEGVNVGANIPIGGVINVGANKTIGEGQNPAQKQKKPSGKSDESAPDEE